MRQRPRGAAKHTERGRAESAARTGVRVPQEERQVAQVLSEWPGPL